MSFWDILFRRPCPNQMATDAEHVKLKQALEEHRKALEQTHEQFERSERSTAALEVAAEALAAITRGRDNHK